TRSKRDWSSDVCSSDLQQFFLRLTQLAQARVAGNNNLFPVGQFVARTRRNDFADQTPTGFRVRLRLCRIKARILKELLCRAGDDEAMVSVVRVRFATLVDPF